MTERSTADSANETCPGCEAESLQSFFQVETAAANVGSLPASTQTALQAARGSIDLAICHQCGLIHNRRFDVSRVGFEPGYEVSLFHTRVFREFIRGVCDRLIERYALRNRRILEIGCGRGEFLRLICQSGGNQGIGIDPTIAQRSTETVGRGNVTFVPGFFQREHTDLLGDFVCCLSVFEAIAKPLAFLRELREGIGNRDIPVYFEVFNGFRSIEHGEVWSIHYEQCNYFSLSSLTRLFRRAGFEIIDAAPCYQGDQYLYVEARPAKSPPESDLLVTSHNSPSLEQMIARTEQFDQDYQERKKQWQHRMSKWRREGTDVVAWGSGGKGISFLNAIDDTNVIRGVVDINPDRQQHYIPLSGHAIVDPTTLAGQSPDVVIVTNPLYRNEIETQLSAMNIHPEILVA